MINGENRWRNWAYTEEVKKKKSTVDATEYSSRHFRTSSRAGFHPLPLLISCQFLRIINRLIIRRIISGVTSARPTSAGLQRQPYTHKKKRRTDNSHCARKPLLTATGEKKRKGRKRLKKRRANAIVYAASPKQVSFEPWDKHKVRLYVFNKRVVSCFFLTISF